MSTSFTTMPQVRKGIVVGNVSWHQNESSEVYGTGCTSTATVPKAIQDVNQCQNKSFKICGTGQCGTLECAWKEWITWSVWCRMVWHPSNVNWSPLPQVMGWSATSCEMPPRPEQCCCHCTGKLKPSAAFKNAPLGQPTMVSWLLTLASAWMPNWFWRLTHVSRSTACQPYDTGGPLTRFMLTVQLASLHMPCLQ